MATKTIAQERAEAIKKSIAKWERIDDLLLHTQKHPCALCIYTTKHPKAKCPLKGEPCVNGQCVLLFSTANAAVGDMLRRLRELEGSE